MSNFHEVRFPARLSLGASGGPERRTEIVTLASGFEERNSPWAQSRRRYDAGVAMQTLDDMHEIVAFFEARHGQLYGFRWKDWADYKSVPPGQEIDASDQEIGIGDGAETAFQLIKTYESGVQTYMREIRKPVAGTVSVQKDGLDLIADLDFTVSAETGVVTLSEAPLAGERLTAGFEFDVPVRFDSDFLEITVASFQAGEIPAVPVVELRV